MKNHNILRKKSECHSFENLDDAWLAAGTYDLDLRDDIDARTCALCGVVFRSWVRKSLDTCCDECVTARKKWVSQSVRATVARRVEKMNNEQDDEPVSYKHEQVNKFLKEIEGKNLNSDIIRAGVDAIMSSSVH